jgi:hypothetical protein
MRGAAATRSGRAEATSWAMAASCDHPSSRTGLHPRCSTNAATSLTTCSGAEDSPVWMKVMASYPALIRAESDGAVYQRGSDWGLPRIKTGSPSP